MVNRNVKENLQWPQRLVELMGKKGLNASQLGKQISVSHVTIGNYLDGQLPKGEHLVSLASYFGITMDELVGLGERKITSLSEAAPAYFDSSELDLWKRRAKMAEQELHDLKSKLREMGK